MAAPFDRENIVEQPPLLSDLSLKSTERKPRVEKIDSGSTSLKSKSSTLRLLLLRAANSLDV